jgi:antitoxin component of MazEF toxin-antitoxin module
MLTYETKIANWGKSTAIRIPSMLLKRSGLSLGQAVRLDDLGGGSIAIHPILDRPQLTDLLDKVTSQNLPDPQDLAWGKPVGSEVW